MEKPIKVIYTINYTANITEEQAEKIYYAHRDGGVLNYPRLLKLIGVDTRDIEFTNRVDGGCWKPTTNRTGGELNDKKRVVEGV